jgi:ankyrin repeat protein
MVNLKTLSDKDNVTPLQTAASAGYWDIVKLLLQYKADPNICGEHALW